jgi:isopenicillin N synthase-like dioxygenase
VLPLIDLGPTWDDAAARAACATQLDAVCREHGFFVVQGHGVPPAVRAAAFDAAQRLFALPDATKARWHIDHSPIRRGWDPVGWQALEPGQPPDLKESFYLGVDRDGADPLVAAGTPNHGPNQWPDEARVPGFRSAVDAYRTALDVLSRHIMGLLALGLRLPYTYFDACLTDPMPVLRLLRYPPNPELAAMPRSQMGCGAHTDWGGITVLAQDLVGGLQIKRADDRWMDVAPLPDTFVVNLGDLMQRWTNGAYRSTLHRVLPMDATRQRYSIAWFFDVNYHTLIEPLPGCASAQQPARHPPITAGEHLIEQYRRTTVQPAAALT